MNKKTDIEIFEILKSSRIFYELSDTKIKELSAFIEVIKLDTNEILFEQGSPSDCMYLVAAGTLAATLKTTTGEEKIAGTITANQTVGEMGLISAHPRSLTVKALRQSTLLKLSKTAFHSYFVKEPEILLKFVNLIIARSERTIQALRNIQHYVNIAIIPANNDVSIKEFLDKLVDRIPHKYRVKFLRAEDFKDQTAIDKLPSWLSRSELNNDFNLMEISEKNLALSEIFLEHADRIILVGEGNTSPKFSDFVSKILLQKNSIYLKKELVLLYPHNSKNPQNTGEWLEKSDFFRYHHIGMDTNEDIDRLIRFITGRAIGVVLSGGGTKGWAHLGALQAIHDANIPIDAVGGTSIGAVIGACYLMHDNFDDFLNATKKFAAKMENPFSLNKFTFPIISILNGKPGTNAIQDMVGNLQIENLPKPFFCISCNINTGKEAIHSQGSAWLWLRASGSLPGITPPVVFNSSMYVDGGVINNLPVDTMRDFLDGKGKIIAADLISRMEDTGKYNFPTIVTFWDAFLIKLKVGKYKHYKLPNFFNTLLRSLMMGASRRAMLNGASADLLIRPDLSEYNTLNETRSQKLFDMGYELMSAELKNFKIE